MKALILFLLRCYREWVTPLLPPACRFIPSCSSYAEEAVTRHGWAKGSLLAARRIVRCWPLGPHGFDPVPTKEMHRRW